MASLSQIPLGWSLPKRKQTLTEIQTKSGDRQSPINFQNVFRPFEVYRVPIDLPKYRISNGRTEALQEEYLALHQDKPPDFFVRDTESEEVQQVQHALLSNLLKDSNTDLLKYFKKHKQEEDLILSDNGYVVNGNRRLCAMRTLYYGENGKKLYEHFSHIDTIILPPCDPKDIDELEARLQIQRDIKQDYTWIAKAVMMKKRQEQYSYDYDTLGKLYDMDSKEVEELISKLNLADDYLNNIGKHKQYGLVEKKDYAFKQLLKERKKSKKPDEKDLGTAITYALLDSKDIEDRLYSIVPIAFKKLPRIIENFKEQVSEEPVTYQVTKMNPLLGTVKSELKPFIDFVTKPENKQLVVDTVQDIYESEQLLKKQKKKEDSLLQQVAKANTALKDARLCITKDADLSGLEEHLNSIENIVRFLRTLLKNHA